MVLRAETAQERELFDLFKQLTPAQRDRLLVELREIVAGEVGRRHGPSPWAGGG
jgi:hypothetical protein